MYKLACTNKKYILVQEFWDDVEREIQQMEVEDTDFLEQEVPLAYSKQLIEEEAKSMGISNIDPSAKCALSKICELFDLEMTKRSWNEKNNLYMYQKGAIMF